MRADMLRALADPPTVLLRVTVMLWGWVPGSHQPKQTSTSVARRRPTRPGARSITDTLSEAAALQELRLPRVVDRGPSDAGALGQREQDLPAVGQLRHQPLVVSQPRLTRLVGLLVELVEQVGDPLVTLHVANQPPPSSTGTRSRINLIVIGRLT